MDNKIIRLTILNEVVAHKLKFNGIAYVICTIGRVFVFFCVVHLIAYLFCVWENFVMRCYKKKNTEEGLPWESRGVLRFVFLFLCHHGSDESKKKSKRHRDMDQFKTGNCAKSESSAFYVMEYE